MKQILQILFALILVVGNADAVVCSYDSVSWNNKAFEEIDPAQMYDDGVTELTDSITELSFFAITQLYMTMTAEKIKALDYARVNAVSTSLEYQISSYEDRLANASKVKAEIANTRLEVSILLNEIQLAIVAIKSNDVIANEKNKLLN